MVSSSLDFTVSHPGPDNVTVRAPKGETGAPIESDTCGGSSGAATPAAGTRGRSTVTAGAGNGELSITNGV